MKKYFHIFICGIIASGLIVASCSKDDDDDVVFGKVTLGKYQSRLEVPKMLTSGTMFIQHSTKIGKDSVMTYCMEYNPVKNHSRWVAFRYDGKTRGKATSRSDAWADDPKLPDQYKVGPGTFSHGGVRGHLCASSDRLYSVEANKQTFYMTNMTPMQYDFNGNYWTAFEGYVRDIGYDANFADTLYVVKGGTIENGKTNGTVTSSAGKSIVIPKYYFIALLKFKAGKYSAVGFLVEHKDYGYSGNKYAPQSIIANHVVNIDELESKTGIDFFHNLPDNIESSIEAEDKVTLKSTWGI